MRPVTGSLCSPSNFSIAAAGRLVERTGDLDLAVAKLGEGALHGEDARRRADRRPDEFGDRIVAPHGGRLRPGGGGRMHRGGRFRWPRRSRGRVRWSRTVGPVSATCGRAGLAKNGAG